MSLCLIYIGEDRPERGLRRWMECKARAAPADPWGKVGRSRLDLRMLRTIETPDGEILSVPRTHVMERAAAAPLLARAGPDATEVDRQVNELMLTALLGDWPARSSRAPS